MTIDNIRKTIFPLEKMMPLYNILLKLDEVDYMNACNLIEDLLTNYKREVVDYLFKKLVREEGHPIDKDFPIEDWETITLKEVDDVFTIYIGDEMISFLR